MCPQKKKKKSLIPNQVPVVLLSTDSDPFRFIKLSPF